MAVCQDPSPVSLAGALQSRQPSWFGIADSYSRSKPGWPLAFMVTSVSVPVLEETVGLLDVTEFALPSLKASGAMRLQSFPC